MNYDNASEDKKEENKREEDKKEEREWAISIAIRYLGTRFMQMGMTN